jgi:hypothetical protein
VLLGRRRRPGGWVEAVDPAYLRFNPYRWEGLVQSNSEPS